MLLPHQEVLCDHSSHSQDLLGLYGYRSLCVMRTARLNLTGRIGHEGVWNQKNEYQIYCMSHLSQNTVKGGVGHDSSICGTGE